MIDLSANDLFAMSAGEATCLRTDTERLLYFLHRGGNYAHLWTDAGHRSLWFPIVCSPPVCSHGHQHPTECNPLKHAQRHVPKQWLRHNVYFSVHPLSQIPPQSSTGITDPRFIGSQSVYICAVNALFAEFDGKDYVYARDYQHRLPSSMNALSAIAQQQAIKKAQEEQFYQDLEPFKARALRHIESFCYPPSIIIDSGGGYHCYWLLRKSIPLDESNRDDIQLIQHGWVQLVGGDRGAADLRRVLRLPGTYNHKAGFDKPKRVIFVKREFGQLYDYLLLEEAVSDWFYEQSLYQKRRQHRYLLRHGSNRKATKQQSNQTDAQHTLRQQFNERHQIADLLLRHGYQLCSTTHQSVRLARPGRSRLQSSITIFAADNGKPERSIHFSTNDPLYSREFIDLENGTMRRHLHDAFYIYVMLDHNGDWEAAYRAAEGNELQQPA